MEPSVYVLDANVFIEAARHYYAFDLGTRFWDILLQYANEGTIESIDRVINDIVRGRDQLARWVNGEFSRAFRSTNEDDVIEFYRRIMAWVQDQSQYTDAAKAEFANVSDGWLVAYAAAKKRVIVTHEVLNPDIRRRIPIPNVCEAFHIRYINTFDMLRELRAQLA